MKKGILFIAFLLISASAFSQIGYLQYRHVPAEHEEKFVELETKYWSKVAKSAIDAGEMVSWALWRKLGVTNTDAPNYVFTNVFSSLDQMDQTGTWGKHLEKLNYNPSLINTSSISTVTFDYYVQVEDAIPGDYKYALVNYAIPTDLGAFIEENKKLWKPLHEQSIKNGTNGMTAWGITSVIYPQGNMDRFTCYTYDGFNKLSDVMNYLRFYSQDGTEGSANEMAATWENVVSKSKMDELIPDGFQGRIVYELVMSVGQED